jgi:hypothetical protein
LGDDQHGLRAERLRAGLETKRSPGESVRAGGRRASGTIGTRAGCTPGTVGAGAGSAARTIGTRTRGTAAGIGRTAGSSAWVIDDDADFLAWSRLDGDRFGR